LSLQFLAVAPHWSNASVPWDIPLAVDVKGATAVRDVRFIFFFFFYFFFSFKFVLSRGSECLSTPVLDIKKREDLSTPQGVPRCFPNKTRNREKRCFLTIFDALGAKKEDHTRSKTRPWLTGGPMIIAGVIMRTEDLNDLGGEKNVEIFFKNGDFGPI
jgi:hypothetical protein